VSVTSSASPVSLLKAIMNTAVDDGLIRRNPCRIKGAAQDRSPERAVPTVRQVFTLASVIDPRYRAMVLFGVFTSLRWGELAALRRADIDLKARTVRVKRTLTHLSGGGHAFGPPKTDAGRRTVVYPELVSVDLADHLERFTAASGDSLVFTAAVPATHFHDLRHTGNNLTAEAGANAPGADGSDGPQQHSCGPHLPARQRRTAAGRVRRDGRTRRSETR
jgi:integrase